MVQAAALGRLPVYPGGAQLEMVGVEDAARAFLLAAELGRPGERYVISERMMSFREVLTEAALAVGRRPPRVALPLALMKAIGVGGDLVQRYLGRDAPLTSVSTRLSYAMPVLDHGKAERELGWVPAPAQEGVRAAARWFVEQEAARATGTAPGG